MTALQEATVNNWHSPRTFWRHTAEMIMMKPWIIYELNANTHLIHKLMHHPYKHAFKIGQALHSTKYSSFRGIDTLLWPMLGHVLTPSWGEWSEEGSKEAKWIWGRLMGTNNGHFVHTLQSRHRSFDQSHHYKDQACFYSGRQLTHTWYEEELIAWQRVK